ncbi:MAG: hypothetical protein ACO23R_02650 [bacterium]
MFNSEAKASGKLNVVLKDSDGNIKQAIEVPNLVVSTGLAFIASRMKDTTDTAMSHMAIGTGTTAAAAGDTTLGTEAARVALTSTTVTANAIAYVASFGAGTGTGAITEAGLFNAASSGTLLCRTVFDVVNKGASDTLQITWTITLSAS